MYSISGAVAERTSVSVQTALPADLLSAGELPADAIATLDEIRAMRRIQREAAAREFQLAAHFADLYGQVDQDRVVPGSEQLRQLGGDGTPEVAEFATLELAAALGIRDIEATVLISNALAVRHRLPWVWQRVMSGDLPVWRARTLAGKVQDLDYDAARLVDIELSRSLPGMSWTRVEKMVDGLVLAALPAEEAEQRRLEAQGQRGVWISQEDNGVASISGTLDAPYGAVLEETIGWLARILREGGFTGGTDALRAKALGILGTPARALQLMQASLMDQLPEDPEALTQWCAHEGEPGHLCGTIQVDPERLLPKAQLVVHLTDTSLADGAGVVRPVFGTGHGTRIRPLLTEWLTGLLPGMTITVRPVLDVNRQAPSDSYEIPRTMREGLEIRNPYEAFPWSTRRSAGLDLDHTAPWDDHGPPGQTRPDNLGPLTRKVHRAKTHGHWQVQQPLPGVFLWRSPLGFRYLVTPSRTIELGRENTASDTGEPRHDVARAA